MNKKIFTLGLLVVLLVLSSGCGQKPQSSSSNKESNAGSNIQTPAAAVPQENKSIKIEAYYTDDQMLELKKEEREIAYRQEKDKYLEALKALQNSSKQELFPLWGKAVFQSVSLKDGQLTVDLELPDEARLGAGGEALALDALKKTLFQFSEVKTIELLVDGQKVDTLMGHVEIEQPLSRN
ncbi:GerMN domain-containing protein [Paenibacillus puldeungensis]|uniref:GerMN domain-containing protein n=1 Tax=Paenibacillus puldeungensis TaxID=696536 RepID=A0ABW3S276_9BACL